MEAANQANLGLQLPRFKFEGRNHQEFRRNWPQIARHYGIQGVVHGTSQRPILGDDNEEAVAAWDMLNQLALDKLKYYVTDNVHAIVWKGQDGLTANQYYQRMSNLLLRTMTRSIVKLEKILSRNEKKAREKLFEWMCSMDNLFVEFTLAGEPKSDAAMKAHAMAKCGRDWEAIAIFLGQDDGVTYVDWQAAMLEKEQELEETGSIGVQDLAGQLYTQPTRSEGAYATSTQQTWRGSGQSMRGGRHGGRYPQQGRHPISRMTQGRQQSGRNQHFNRSGGRSQQSFNTQRQHGNNRQPFNNQHTQRNASHNRSTGSGSNQGCFTCRRMDHIARNCPSMQCYTCGGYGHSQRNCPTQSSHTAYTNDSNNNTHYSDEYDYTTGFGAINMMITVLEGDFEIPAVANATSTQAHTSKLDSCCTRHMMGFYALKDASEHRVAVIFGNQQKLYSTHIGTLVLSNGVELRDCLFVPGLMWTLISEPRIEMDGGAMTSSSGVRKIFGADGKLMILAHMNEHTYCLTNQLHQFHMLRLQIML